VAPAVAAHVAGMLAGSAATASLLVLSTRLLGRLPGAAVAVICLLAAAALLAEPRLQLPGSHWMVPRSWARFGHSGFAALFGLALGAGFVTVLPSAGWYGVVAAAQAGAPAWTAFAVLLAFGVARAAMVPVLTVRSMRDGAHPVARIGALATAQRRLRPVEMLLLVALGCVVLVH
jgi:hypothetical protein